HNCLPESQQGKHQKIKSLIDNEDFIKKSIYWDRHEKPDVVEYRAKFLEAMALYTKYIIKFDKEFMNEILLNLPPDCKE
ncbi:1530_t:CDS:2, partial [Racocetra fulgida]